jgi:serine protease
VLAVLAVPQPQAPPPPSIVNVVEFYNASLDHYFITADVHEIGDLDTGVHMGWTRTGQTFNAYAIDSTGSTGRRPVCRIYGQPSAGLDSHFYSASPDECFATAVRFPYSWAIEADEVFELDLPDGTSGECPAGDIPVYRLWNGRTDSNHRYTTSIAIRDQMIANHYISEGYGANGVALCALP